MKKRLIKIIISAILFVIAIVFKFENEWINNSIFLGSYIIVGFDIIKKAIKNIFRGKVFDENFLMAVATIGAFAIKEFPEAVGVMLFYQIGELFQSYAVDKSRKSIANLMDIRPDYANLNKDGILEKVDPDDVKIGEQIIVKPGEKIPLDGIIISGESMIDTSALTGESVPRRAKIGDELLSGCINQTGVLNIKVTKEYDESTVSKILELVENASSKKSKSENFISKFAKYYTPTVVIIAMMLAIIPTIIFGMNTFSEWIYRALTFLVVSCPCALVISIPMGFFGGIGGASKIGILIKGSNYLENLSKTKTVIFDKTGTLTKGVFEVQKIKANHLKKIEFIKYVAEAESYSSHPIAVSIKEEYKKLTGVEIEKNTVKDVEEISGYGIKATIEEKELLIGNNKLLEKYNIEYEVCNDEGTVIYVVIDHKYEGYILISDTIKEDSIETIKELKKCGINRTIMLTGDRKNVGEDVASKLKIDEVYTELLPDGKAKKVEEILKRNKSKGKIVFVGDGINDAPVLALSDIGIAMGGLGSDAAIEAADIVIMTDEPSKIISAINISKKTLKIVKENIIFAIFVKILVLILGALGISTMWEAVFADVGVSVLAILNALRMLKVK